MGWSCRSEAAEVMRKWTDACLAQTNMQNEFFVQRGKSASGAPGPVDRYFWELSRKEHNDGAITGTIMKVLSTTPEGVSMAKRCGAFRIEGDGTITCAPKFLKKASK